MRPSDGSMKMNYIKLLIIVLFASIIIKMYLYPKIENESYIEWASKIYEKKINFIIDGLLVLMYFAFYNKYSFSTMFFSSILLSALLLPVAIIDLRTKIIPDKPVLLGIGLGIIITLFDNEISILSGLMGFIICGGTMAAISIVTRGAIGMGDAKLFACIGAFLGIQLTIGIMLLSTIFSGLTGLLLLIFKNVDRKATIPFAPFIFVSTMFIIIVR